MKKLSKEEERTASDRCPFGLLILHRMSVLNRKFDLLSQALYKILKEDEKNEIKN